MTKQHTAHASQSDIIDALKQSNKERGVIIGFLIDESLVSKARITELEQAIAKLEKIHKVFVRLQK